MTSYLYRSQTECGSGSRIQLVMFRPFVSQITALGLHKRRKLAAAVSSQGGSDCGRRMHVVYHHPDVPPHRLITVNICGCTKLRKVVWYSRTGIFYLFLPSSADGENKSQWKRKTKDVFFPRRLFLFLFQLFLSLAEWVLQDHSTPILSSKTRTTPSTPPCLPLLPCERYFIYQGILGYFRCGVMRSLFCAQIWGHTPCSFPLFFLSSFFAISCACYLFHCFCLVGPSSAFYLDVAQLGRGAGRSLIKVLKGVNIEMQTISLWSKHKFDPGSPKNGCTVFIKIVSLRKMYFCFFR